MNIFVAVQVADELGETPRDILVQLGAKAAEEAGSGGGNGGYGRLVSELDLLARVAAMRDAGEQEAGAGAGTGGDCAARPGAPAAWTLRAMRSLLAAAGGPGRGCTVRALFVWVDVVCFRRLLGQGVKRKWLDGMAGWPTEHDGKSGLSLRHLRCLPWLLATKGVWARLSKAHWDLWGQSVHVVL